MKKIFITLTLLSIVYGQYGFCQQGQFYIKDFPEGVRYSEQFWDIEQDENGNILLAGRKGLFSFNGNQWSKIDFPGIVFSIKYDHLTGNMFVGCNGSYGFIELDEYGNYEYHPLQSSLENVVFSNIYFTESSVYFYSSELVCRHDRSSKEFNKNWKPKNNSYFTGLLVTKDNVFFNVSGTGLYRLDSDTLFPIVTGYWLENDEILFSLPFDEEHVLMGTTANKLYKFDGMKFYNYKFKDEDYIDENLLANGAILDEDRYVFSTLTGGVIIVDREKKEILNSVNYQTGLPDNEIYNVFVDNSKGIWVTHEYGLSRIDINLPLKNYSIYPGFEGKILGLTIFDSVFYVATNDGIYYLDEVKDYEDVEVLVRKQVKTSPTIFSKDAQKKDEKVDKDSGRSVLNRLFGKKKKDGDKGTTKKESAKSTSKKPRTRTTYVKKKKSVLKSVSHVYKKIENLDIKVRQMIPYNDGILVSSNSGLYTLKGSKSEIVIENTYINSVSQFNTDNICYVSAFDGFYTLTYKDDEWEITNVDKTVPYDIFSFVRMGDFYWAGIEDGVIRVPVHESIDFKGAKEYSFISAFPEICYTNLINDSLFVLNENGIFYYNHTKDTFQTYILSDNIEYDYLIANNIAWIRINESWLCKDTKYNDLYESQYIDIMEDISWLYPDSLNLWLVSGNDVFKVIGESDKQVDSDLILDFIEISLSDGEKLKLDALSLPPNRNSLVFKMSATSYVRPDKVNYQYYIEGLSTGWSQWTEDPEFQVVLPPGSYTVMARARDAWNNISKSKEIPITITKPFTSSIYFFLIIGFAILVLFYFVIKIREKKLIHDKMVLEEKVRQRTIEIQEQKEEIEAQRDEISKQNVEITASIEYASRIQKALLPLKDHFKKAFQDHFILYKPRDIVSGDFYWIAENKEKLIFTAADCTGHGVPGAFMSMLGISSLNEIFASVDNLSASKILGMLREKIKFTLHQTGKEGEAKDGMDMSLCVLNKKTNVLEFAGAYNPMYLVQNGELKEIKGDRMPIGIHHTEKEEFTNNEIKVKKGDFVYLFSDGYPDQFGGPDNMKFKTSNFRKLIESLSDYPLEKQKEILDNRFYEWKGNVDQIDDVIVIGVKL